ncbi:MAG: hypothetical protein A3G71_04090 [Gammaproteobacteria bacterium RIFCSPLOWO2_12_FULL_38_14]|nr:MAG: hypothetical protein A3B69_00350 [Gammaproteobacteria bacterium RIFCSPHIGHO2_02_FULL_38_33]OGT23283.1 MAG: hypothetical protein A2W47_06595 [Gammaproteobacteria bacterium RIFCSPHIGHO2_12_38_15]OGT77091.1 MAG: hypothetical protein A3G71_04090 [Gammaproteobacteria bacterium RIFCSPLOWO2_12_FULL_38_14]
MNKTFDYITPSEEIIPRPLPPVTQYIVQQILATRLFTKTSIAKELQVSLITINRWTTGTIKRPTHKTFSRLLTLYCSIQKEIYREKKELVAA